MQTTRLLKWMGLAAATLAPLAFAFAQTDPAPDVDVVVTAPVQGSAAERDRVPVNTQVLRRDDLERTGPASALRALDERVGGIALDEAQGNPFQPNLIYRGFEASQPEQPCHARLRR